MSYLMRKRRRRHALNQRINQAPVRFTTQIFSATLGLWTVAGNVTYSPDNGVLRSGGEATLTAANGDKLEFEIDGVLDPITATDQVVFRFVGGARRFQAASGSADFVVTINPLTGGFELTVVGRINF